MRLCQHPVRAKVGSRWLGSKTSTRQMSETSLSAASTDPYDNSHQDRQGEIIFKALIKTGYLVMEGIHITSVL